MGGVGAFSVEISRISHDYGLGGETTPAVGLGGLKPSKHRRMYGIQRISTPPVVQTKTPAFPRYTHTKTRTRTHTRLTAVTHRQHFALLVSLPRLSPPPPPFPSPVAATPRLQQRPP